MNYYQGIKKVIKDPKKLADLEATGNYVAEPKLDGLWVSIFTDDGGEIKKIVSRTGKEKTGKGFDDFIGKDIGLPKSVLVGELITTESELHIFDIPVYKNKDITGRNILRRRKLLEKLKIFNNKIKLVPQFKDNFVKHYNQITNEGGEGLVLKKVGKNTPYIPGSRTPDWMKVKPKTTMDYVIVGYTISDSGKFEGMVKALRLGLYDDGKIKEVGKVGSMTDQMRKEITHNKDKLIGKVIEVGGNEVFKSGAMRHPYIIKLRDDLEPKDATLGKTEIIENILNYFKEEFVGAVSTKKDYVEIFKNPTQREINESLKPKARFIIDLKNKNFYIFSSHIIHIQAFRKIYNIQFSEALSQIYKKRDFLLGELGKRMGKLYLDETSSHYATKKEIEERAPWALKYIKR